MAGLLIVTARWGTYGEQPGLLGGTKALVLLGRWQRRIF